jgi:hypothetical protein
MATFDVTQDADFPLVARLRHANGNCEDIRHDGEHFYRTVCRIDEGRSAFPKWMLQENYLRRTYLKLMDDGRHIEYSELTWPNKAEGRKERRHVPFTEVASFELVESEDVSRCETEIALLTASIRLHGGIIWIRCGEPCYLIRSQNRLTAGLSFSDQDTGANIEEMYISASHPELLREQWEAVATKTERDAGYYPGVVEIIDPSVFERDFDDAAFIKYARITARAIAYYLSGNEWFSDGQRLMSAKPDDIDTWNALRRTILTMEAAGTASAGKEETVTRAAELWSQLGGCFSAKSGFMDRQMVGRWCDPVVRRWFDRKIELDHIVSPLALTSRQ